MAYDRLDLATGDTLDADVFRRIDDAIEALDLALDSKVVEVEKQHRSTNRFDTDNIPFYMGFYVGNKISPNGTFEHKAGTGSGGGWVNIPVEPGKTYTMSITPITLSDLNIVYGNFQNIFFTDINNKVVTHIAYDAGKYWTGVSSGTDKTILDEVAYNANKITSKVYGSGSNSYRGLRTSSMQIEIKDESIAFMHVMIGCNDYWKYQIDYDDDFVNRGRLTESEINQLQNSFQINEGITLLEYEKGGDYSYTVLETQSNLTKLQSSFSQKEIPSTNLLNPAYVQRKYTSYNSLSNGRPNLLNTSDKGAMLLIPVSIGDYVLHSKSETTIGNRTFAYFGRSYFVDADGGYITGNYPFGSATGFTVGYDKTKVQVSGEKTSTFKFSILDENIKYAYIPISDNTKDNFGLWADGTETVTDEYLYDIVYNMQLNSGKKLLEWEAFDNITYRSMISPEFIDGLDEFQTNMEEKIDNALANAISKDSNMVVIIEDNKMYVKAKRYTEDTHFIWRNVKSKADNYDSNRFFNIDEAFTCSSSYSDDDISSMSRWKYCNDDICPLNFNGTYIGANHGFDCLDRITVTGHNKTETDIGSIWSCNNKNYVLVRIYDANTLDMVMFNDTNMSTGKMGWGSPNGTMTHKSGATNTSDIVVESVNNYQLKRAINNYSISLYVDGKQTNIDSNGIYTGNRIDFVTQYNIIYVPAMLNYLMNNVGNNTNDSQCSEEISDFYITVYIDYQFNMNGSISTYSSFYVNKELEMGYFGLVQSGAISDDTYMYIPDTTYDSITLQGGATKKFTPSAWNSENKAPYRYYQWADASINKGIAMVYDRTIGIGDNTKRLAQLSSAGQYYYTEKMYPALINGGTLSPGTFIDGMAARVPLYKYDPDLTSVGWYWSGDDIHLMIDTHSSVNKDVVLPDYMNNMRIEVLDKTDSMNFNQTYIFNNKLRVQCTDYGYLVLRLYK